MIAQLRNPLNNEIIGRRAGPLETDAVGCGGDALDLDVVVNGGNPADARVVRDHSGGDLDFVNETQKRPGVGAGRLFVAFACEPSWLTTVSRIWPLVPPDGSHTASR